MKGITIVIIGTLLSLGLLIGGSDTQVVGETPCVDGQNRVNLEGIMCENIEYTWFGLSIWKSILSVIPQIVSIFLMFVVDAKNENKK